MIYRFVIALFAVLLLRADMYPDASNAKLPEANINLGNPLFYVEHYRQSSDPAGDDTLPVQRACDAAKVVNGAVMFGNKDYTISPITIGNPGSVVGAPGAGLKCDLVGASLRMPILSTTGGTKLTLKAGSNASMITVPMLADAVRISNMTLDGNKANNTCTSGAVVFMENNTSDPGRKRGVVMQDVRVENSCWDGIYAGLNRNAGILDHVTVVMATRNGITVGSNSDWRFFAVDAAGSSAGSALAMTGAGTLTSIASNYFSGKNNIRLEGAAADNTFIGGSIDGAHEDGVVLIGDGADNKYALNIIGMKFSGNGLLANNTYADVRLVGQPGCVLVGNYFQRASAAGTDLFVPTGSWPKYLVESDATSRCAWAGNTYQIAGSNVPYESSPTNNWGNLVQQDPTSNQSFRVDTNSNAISRVRVLGGTAGAAAAMVGTEMSDGSAGVVPLRLVPGGEGPVWVEADNVRVEWVDTAGAVDQKRYYVMHQGNHVYHRLLNDARDTSTAVMDFQRSGVALQAACFGGDVGANCPLQVQGATGHISIKGGGTPTLNTCGTTPSVSGTDQKGTITVGAGVVTSCQVSFGNAFSVAPSCTVSGNGTGGAAVSINTGPSLSGFTIGATSDIGTKKVSYHCWE